MARGTSIARVKYETDGGLIGSVYIDKNWANAARAGAPPAGATDIPWTFKRDLNETESGLHLRTVTLVQNAGVIGDTCVIGTSRKYMRLVILTKARFDALQLWDGVAAGTNLTAISLSHKPGGGGVLEWFIVKKNEEYAV